MDSLCYTKNPRKSKALEKMEDFRNSLLSSAPDHCHSCTVILHLTEQKKSRFTSCQRKNVWYAQLSVPLRTKKLNDNANTDTHSKQKETTSSKTNVRNLSIRGISHKEQNSEEWRNQKLNKEKIASNARDKSPCL